MIGFEVVLNGAPLCVTGAGEDGALSVIVSSVSSRRELTLHIGGLTDEAHLSWPVPRDLVVGDEVTVRVVEHQAPDPPVTTLRADNELLETAERAEYERLRKKFKGR